MAHPTIWEKDPHTEVKHKILEGYLNAWFPILAKQKRLIYLDGFAGPGIYDNEKIGSPIIALKCLMNHAHNLTQTDAEFIFIFIENDKNRGEILEQEIKSRFPELPHNVKYFIEQDKFESTMTEVLDQLEKEGKHLAPTFAFIDPFGYSGVPLCIIRKILEFKRCEVFINFAYNSINRFIETSDSREKVFDALFGTEDWRNIRKIQDSKKRNIELNNLYTKQLKASAKYIRSFEMVNTLNQTTYQLFFATNNSKGFEVMKQSMWRADPRGLFRFSDTTDANNRFLLSFMEDTKYRDQADLIFSQFEGMVVTKEMITTFCIEKTGFPTLWSKSLKILEEENKLSLLSERKRKGTFPERCKIQFHKNK